MFVVAFSFFFCMFFFFKQKTAYEMSISDWISDVCSSDLQVFKNIGKHVPPPPGAKSPALWGTRAQLAALFGPHASSIKSTQRNFVFRYRSPEHWLEVFKTYYGPVLKTFAALEPAARSALERDLKGLIEQFNRSGDDSMVVPGEYLERSEEHTSELQSLMRLSYAVLCLTKTNTIVPTIQSAIQ